MSENQNSNPRHHLHPGFIKTKPGQLLNPFLKCDPQAPTPGFISTPEPENPHIEANVSTQEQASSVPPTPAHTQAQLPYGSHIPAQIKNTDDGLYYFPEYDLSRLGSADSAPIIPFQKGIKIPQECLEEVIKKYASECKPTHKSIALPTELQNYRMTEDGIWGRSKEAGDFELLCNFQLNPQKMIQDFFGDTLQSTSIQFLVTLHNEEYPLTIDTKNLDNLAKKVCDSYPTAIVYTECPKAEQKISIFFRSCLRGLPTETVQHRIGWFSFQSRKIFAHDARSFITDEPVMQTGKSILHTPQELKELGNTFLSFLHLGPLNVTAPMVATAILGPLHLLFEEADSTYTPHFVLFINGATGSLKTAVSQVVFNVYNTLDPYVPATFNDTEASLEVRLKELPHSSVLIDDFCSTTRSANRKEMQSKLEKVIRFVGDGIGKNRSNANLQDVKGTRPSGTVVVTGEDTAGQMSTLLRCFVLCVNHDTFNKEILSLFQSSRLKWSSFVWAFIGFVENNFDPIVQYIRNTFPALRRDYQKEFSDLRPVDQLVQVTLAFHILGSFLQQSAPELPGIKESIASCIESCRKAVKESHEYISQNSAERLYAFALAKLISEGEIVLSDSHKMFKLSPLKFDGFMENGYLYLKSDAVYSKICQRFKQQGRVFPFTSLEVKRSLHYAGLSVIEIEKKDRKDEKIHWEVKVQIGEKKRPRMLKIDFAAFQAYTGSEN